MVILTKYKMEQISDRFFYIRCREYKVCPRCGCKLYVIGSRKRKYINKDEENITLIIRRLKCRNCKRIHHELPDILVPYKRYESSSIGNALTDLDNSIVSAEESTIHRWRKWFTSIYIRLLIYILSIPAVAGMKSKIYYSLILIHLYTNYPNWLTIIVRQLVNSDFW